MNTQSPPSTAPLQSEADYANQSQQTQVIPRPGDLESEQLPITVTDEEQDFTTDDEQDELPVTDAELDFTTDNEQTALDANDTTDDEDENEDADEDDDISTAKTTKISGF